MTQQDDRKLPPEPIDADQANQEFWEQVNRDRFHLPDFHRSFDGNLVDYSSNQLGDSILMKLLAISCFTFGWFLSAILFF